MSFRRVDPVLGTGWTVMNARLSAAGPNAYI
jgi:hypothetical protein